MKKIISLTLLFCLLGSLLAIPVLAEEAELLDLALRRRVTASGELSGHEAEKAVDGFNYGQADSWIVGGSTVDDIENRFTDGNLVLDSMPIDRLVYFRIDLGTHSAFDRMQFLERRAGNPRGRAAGWVIEISDDDETWTEVISGNWLAAEPAPADNYPHSTEPYNVDFDRVEARFVRVRFTAAAHVNIGFFQISVFNRSGIMAEGEAEFRAAEAEAEAIRLAEREAAAAQRAAEAEARREAEAAAAAEAAAQAEAEAAEAAAQAEAEGEATETESEEGETPDTTTAPPVTNDDDDDGFPIVIVLIIVGVVVAVVVVVIVVMQKGKKENTTGGE